MIKISKIFSVLLLLVFFFSCSKDNSGFTDEDPGGEIIDKEEDPPITIESKKHVEGIRIAWDYQSLKQISENNSNKYLYIRKPS